MPSEFNLSRRVEFAETDMAGIAHFSRFFHWMEEAEHAFFRSMGFSVNETREGIEIGWPRLSASCDYSNPIRFEEVLDIRLKVTKKGQKTLSYRFTFERDSIEIASGQLITICCKRNHEDKLESIPIPKEIDEMIEVAEAH